MASLAFKTLGGDGQDLVLIHGFGSDRLSWAGTSPALMAVARVHALDLPGHGDSLDADAGDGSARALAEAVTAALDAHGLGKVHLLGHSLGGSIAMLMALKDPGRVRSLTLLAPAGLGHAIDHGFLSRYPALETKEEAGALLQKLVSKPPLISRFTVARVLEQLSRPGARGALRAIAKGVAAHEEQLREAAQRIAASGLPRFVIFGGADAINPPSPAALAAFGGRQLVIPEAGHLPHVEAARLVNAGIADFITTVST
ncbi:MAG: alpha/beta fold hydrolase [Aestuariivirga sp.]|uniref:alpha/beta fold hydrolase n=1 Tax=Aestuariivirga sp. TaxID=2650926 RepID=UPI0025BEE39C|nr:alpha/beta fold hydrolase [Aestuariivirga sp.]MCA3559562.1 alpha/beta fold hydrolase [Aestuariivirga sp.]